MHEDYISEVVSHLNNRKHYRKLDKDPTDIFIQDIKTVLSDVVTVLYRRKDSL